MQMRLQCLANNARDRHITYHPYPQKRIFQTCLYTDPTMNDTTIRGVSAVWLIIVAGIWGATNPFIKRGSKGIESIKASSPFRQFLAELWFLMTNWKYLVPFLMNQSGSVLYYVTLASADLSLAVPITNSLTFIFTAISGHILGERVQSKNSLGDVPGGCWGNFMCHGQSYLNMVEFKSGQVKLAKELKISMLEES